MYAKWTGDHSLDLNQTLKIIQHHHAMTTGITKPHLILFIDEIAKSKSASMPNRDIDILSIACGAMEYVQTIEYASASVLSTTLDPDLLCTAASKSNRTIVIFPLPTLQSLEAIYQTNDPKVLNFVSRFGGVSSLT